MPIVALYNPVCGDGTAQKLFEDTVLPLLEKGGKSVSKVLVTERVEHAGELLHAHLETTEGEATVILGSGDGTLHEIINYLSTHEFKGSRASGLPLSLRIALVPCGTANALYASLYPPTDPAVPEYNLQSVKAFINDSETIPLTITITTISSSPSERKKPQVLVSAVVTSLALHASILHDSEALRAEHPGLERYKIAASQNDTRWYHGHLKLLPTGSGSVQQYNPATKQFEEHDESYEDNPVVDIYGPFAYFVSTVNVDRLEPAFRVTPLAREHPTEKGCMDVVIVRPYRAPNITMDTEELRKSFKDIVWGTLGAAYQNGGHIGLRYKKDGSVGSDGDGHFVVEYARCGGWEWVPDDVDERAHLLCSDGAIAKIPQGGRAVSTAATPTGNAGFKVFV